MVITRSSLRQKQTNLTLRDETSHVQPHGITKRRSTRLAEKRAQTLASKIDSTSDEFDTESISDERTIRSESFCEDSASEFDDCSSITSGSETNELAYASTQSLQYNHADWTEKRFSIDSRCESDNENYEFDDFVVDVSDDNASNAGSEVTLASETSDDRGRTQSSVEQKGNKMTVGSSTMTGRKDSALSTSSNHTCSSNGLFVSDASDPSKVMLHGEQTSFATDMLLMLHDASSADVAEEISDAICRFSRRCNRYSPPLGFILTIELLDDPCVFDALERAQELGLGSVERLMDGTGRMVCIIGPKN